MKKIFLIGFSTSILIEVAKNLKARNINIVYWQGYRDDFDELARTKVGFEDTIFRHNYDAVKNIPPKGMDTSCFEPVNQEIIERMHPYGWYILSMISRTDYMNSVFIKRRHVYYSYLKFWQGILKVLKPDIVVFNSVPHLALGFTLYGLAKLLNIKTVILEQIVTLGSRALILDDYQGGFRVIHEAYERIKNEACLVEDLSDDLRDYYLKNKQILQTAPSGNNDHAHLRTHHNTMPYQLPNFSAIARNIYRFTFFKTAKSYLSMLFSTRKTHYYDKDFTGLELTWMTRRWGKINKSFQKEYQKLQVQPDYRKKYIYIPLAFQPEHTTLPMGGVFDDQLLMIDMIASVIPDDWVIYVKEHLPQWYPHHVQAHTYRYEGYYREIATKKNVCLVPAETHPRELIQNAQAVATITGSAGWEALLSGKPALVFGHVWYMYCDGIFRVSNLAECQDAMQKVQAGFEVSEQGILQYLKALEGVSIKVKNYKTRIFKENEPVSREENIVNITQALYRAIINNSN